MFQFEERTITEYGPCECCGDVSLLASGLVRRDDEPYAAYQVHWTKNQVVKHGAEFYIVLGEFGGGTTAADKFAVALHLFVEADRHGFMVVDADPTTIASHPLVGRALPRSSVIDTPLAEEVFELVDAIWLEDENIADLRDSLQYELEDEGCQEWPFDQGPNVTAVTTRQVLELHLPVLVVTHYSDDHSWGFVCGTTNDYRQDGRVVCMADILSSDPSLRHISDLPPGWSAERKDLDSDWHRYPDADA